ncbi:hypothetical protein HanPI659440_Chr15g0579191 [Helianthus annuus]|nr:hypothetical protein HanPI659440_Chr15g0579191 [Helianthus annuus]
MEPIKSNHHPSQYPPLDLAEIKSQPLKLTKITTSMAVIYGFLSWWLFPHFPVHDLLNSTQLNLILLQTWVVVSIQLRSIVI